MHLAYAADWLADPNASSLSRAMPKREVPYDDASCKAVFVGLLPEEAQRTAVARALGDDAGGLRPSRHDIAQSPLSGRRQSGLIPLYVLAVPVDSKELSLAFVIAVRIGSTPENSGSDHLGRQAGHSHAAKG